MLLLERTMARKPGGRPKRNEDGTGGSKQIRVNDDLGEMIRWIVAVDVMQGGELTTAKLLDPILRPIITRRFAAVREVVDKLKAIEDEAISLRRAALESPPDVSGSAGASARRSPRRPA